MLSLFSSAQNIRERNKNWSTHKHTAQYFHDFNRTFQSERAHHTLLAIFLSFAESIIIIIFKFLFYSSLSTVSDQMIHQLWKGQEWVFFYLSNQVGNVETGHYTSISIEHVNQGSIKKYVHIKNTSVWSCYNVYMCLWADVFLLSRFLHFSVKSDFTSDLCLVWSDKKTAKWRQLNKWLQSCDFDCSTFETRSGALLMELFEIR